MEQRQNASNQKQKAKKTSTKVTQQSLVKTSEREKVSPAKKLMSKTSSVERMPEKQQEQVRTSVSQQDLSVMRMSDQTVEIERLNCKVTTQES